MLQNLTSGLKFSIGTGKKGKSKQDLLTLHIEPENPEKTRIKKISNEANELADIESRNNEFYRNFVPEWKRILIKQGNSSERADELTGLFSESNNRGNLAEVNKAHIAREKIISSISRLSNVSKTQRNPIKNIEEEKHARSAWSVKKVRPNVRSSSDFFTCVS